MKFLTALPKSKMLLLYPGNHLPAEAQFLRTQSVLEFKAEQPGSKANIDFYFTISDPTALPFLVETPNFIDSWAVLLEFSIDPAQFHFIDLAQKTFEGSLPLEGEALEILRFTSKRLQSKTPTRLL